MTHVSTDEEEPLYGDFALFIEAHPLMDAGAPDFMDIAGDLTEAYVCADHGCACGWVYVYEPGEPMSQWVSRA